MGLDPRCRKCKSILTDFGGILLSSPKDDGSASVSNVEKSHLCKSCTVLVEKFIDGER